MHVIVVMHVGGPIIFPFVKGLGENKDEKKERKNHSKKRMKKGMLCMLAICMLVRNVGLLCKPRKAS